MDYRRWHVTDGAARRYEDLYGQGTYDTWVWDLEKTHLLRALDRYLGPKPHVRLLDFACGTGRIIAFLEPLVGTATGVDVSGSMLAVAQQRVKKATLLRADITQENVLRDEKFDLVTAFRFFLNADPALRSDALTVIHRMLAPDGILIMNVHRNLLSLRLPGYVIRRWLQRRTMTAMPPWTVLRLLARHGFEVAEIAGVGMATPVMYRLFGRQACDQLEHTVMRLPSLGYLAGEFILVCRKI